MNIAFNKTYITGSESAYIQDVISSKNLSGNGKYTELCHNFFKEKFGYKHCLLTSSCTDALEMCAILLDIKEGDEVILPTYTFVSAANAFVLRGAKIVFADSTNEHPNLDPKSVEALVTEKTKAIIVVHYGGVSVDMDPIMEIAQANNIYVVEDAAQALTTKYKSNYIGTIGHLATFSFHATKNITSGEGGLLVVNDEQFIKRSEIIWEKGTNRTAFKRGEVEKYTWVDIGSSFLPSELTAAFLWGQLQHLYSIQNQREISWKFYFEKLKQIEGIQLPNVSNDSTNNAHIFYILCKSLEQRNTLSSFLNKNNIQAYFHFLCLHKSPAGKKFSQQLDFPNADKFENCLLRLPLHNSIRKDEQEHVVDCLQEFFNKS